MANISQLTSDLADLKQAVLDDQAAISAVQSYVQAQAAEIVNLEQQLNTIQSQGGANLDLSGLEASIGALKAQNQALASSVPSSATPAAGTTPAAATSAASQTTTS